MSPWPPDPGHEELRRAAHRRARWRERGRREGERPVWRNLATIGALGWLVAVPAVLGALVGRWLDRALGTGIEMSAALIFAGAALGGYLAWQRMNRE